MNAIHTLVTLIPVILGGLIGYLYAIRGKKLDRFYTQVDHSLSQILGPMYHRLRNIVREHCPSLREELIKEFFQHYSSSDSGIHRIGNYSLLKLYYEADDLFQCFLIRRNPETGENFRVRFSELRYAVELEFREDFQTLYRDYVWTRGLLKRDYVYRMVKETVVWFYQTIKSVVILVVILLLLLMYSSFAPGLNQ